MDYKDYYLKNIEQMLSSYGLSRNLISDILRMNFDEIMYILVYLDNTMNKYKTKITSEDYYPVISYYSSSTTPVPPIISKPTVPVPKPPVPVPKPPAPAPIIPTTPVLSPDDVTLAKYTSEFNVILNSYDSNKIQETKNKLFEVFNSDNPIVLKNKLFRYYIIMNFDNTPLRYHFPAEIFTDESKLDSEYNKLHLKFKNEFVIKTFEKYYNGSDKKLRLFYLLYLFEINKIYDIGYLDNLIKTMISKVEKVK